MNEDRVFLAWCAGAAIGLGLAAAFGYAVYWLAVHPGGSLAPTPTLQLALLAGSLLGTGAFAIAWRCIDRPRHPALAGCLEMAWRIPGFAFVALNWIYACVTGNVSTIGNEKRPPQTSRTADPPAARCK